MPVSQDKFFVSGYEKKDTLLENGQNINLSKDTANEETALEEIDLNDPEVKKVMEMKGLTAFEGSLALLSVIVGGGIVGIPYANYTSGLTFGIILNIISPILAFTSGYLFMTCKLMAPIKIETLYELGYFTMGKCSIYFISFIAIVCNQGFVMIYFIVFGGCA